MTRSEARMQQEQEAREVHQAKAQERIRLIEAVNEAELEPDAEVELIPIDYEAAYKDLLSDLGRLATTYRAKLNPRVRIAVDPGYKALQGAIKRGLTLTAIAHKLAVKPNTVAQWASRERVPGKYREPLKKLR